MDELPDDGKVVLISVKGVNYVATYDAHTNLFRVEDELRETVFKVKDSHIYWTEYVSPPDKQ